MWLHFYLQNYSLNACSQSIFVIFECKIVPPNFCIEWSPVKKFRFNDSFLYSVAANRIHVLFPRLHVSFTGLCATYHCLSFLFSCSSFTSSLQTQPFGKSTFAVSTQSRMRKSYIATIFAAVGSLNSIPSIPKYSMSSTQGNTNS